MYNYPRNPCTTTRETHVQLPDKPMYNYPRNPCTYPRNPCTYPRNPRTTTRETHVQLPEKPMYIPEKPMYNYPEKPMYKCSYSTKDCMWTFGVDNQTPGGISKCFKCTNHPYGPRGYTKQSHTCEPGRDMREHRDK